MEIKFKNTETGELVVIKDEDKDKHEKFDECMGNREFKLIFD